MPGKDFVTGPAIGCCVLCSISRVLYKQFPAFLYTQSYRNLYKLKSWGPAHHTSSYHSDPCLPAFSATCALEKHSTLRKLDCPGEISHESSGCFCGPGRTPLLSAAGNGHVEVVELLLQSGASVEAQNDNGDGPRTD